MQNPESGAGAAGNRNAKQENYKRKHTEKIVRLMKKTAIRKILAMMTVIAIVLTQAVWVVPFGTEEAMAADTTKSISVQVQYKKSSGEKPI